MCVHNLAHFGGSGHTGRRPMPQLPCDDLQPTAILPQPGRSGVVSKHSMISIRATRRSARRNCALHVIDSPRHHKLLHPDLPLRPPVASQRWRRFFTVKRRLTLRVSTSLLRYHAIPYMCRHTLILGICRRAFPLDEPSGLATSIQPISPNCGR